MTDTNHGDQVNASLVADHRQLSAILNKDSEHVRPYEAGLIAEAGLRFAAISHDCAGRDFLTGASRALEEEGGAAFIEGLSPAAIGAIILNLPLTRNGDPDGPIDKHLAVEVAEALGPDWAQALYRFTVLVTKLA